jgi:hypothetical protein
MAAVDGDGFGIFTGPDPVGNKVISVGDSLFGSIVRNLGFFRDGLNNQGQIAFFASFADGTQGIYRADPITTQLVTIDIKPGGFPNSINPKSQGAIPVAILTSFCRETAVFLASTTATDFPSLQSNDLRVKEFIDVGNF